MSAIQPIAWLDPFPLTASLPAKMGLFKAGTPRLLALRGPRKDTLPEECNFAWYAPHQKWVEAKNLLTKIMRGTPATGPLDLGGVRLEMLDPGARTDWTEEPIVQGWITLRMALRINPGCVMIYGVELMNPAVGCLNAVSPGLPHCSINLGDTACVSMEMTVRPQGAKEGTDE